ncbi:MAG TPA: hypothetical protein VJA21_01125 [Verrucomicrobiae bacterium]
MKRFITSEVEAPDPAQPPARPEFLRLPKPGLLCPYTGLTRSAINELILPTPRNGNKPPVRSFCLRQRGAKTGIRLVDYDSISAYIRQHEETFQGTN